VAARHRGRGRVVAISGGAVVEPNAPITLWLNRALARGIGRVLFGAAVSRAKWIKAGALMITAEPSAEGFYKRMGAIRIGEGPFYFSPETILPSLLYIIPPQT